MQERIQNMKESWKNVPEKTRKLVIAIAAGTLAIALIAIAVLRFGANSEYSDLFTGLSQEEAQDIGVLLQNESIDYKYDASDGTIKVPADVVEATRGRLLVQGYPKNGFAYKMYLDHTGLMTTESDKKQITLYELQDRLGATIRSFDGVQEARVNIAEASERRYVLEDNTEQGASASVVVTMRNGETLTEEKAQAVKHLISHAVRGMNFTEVVVLDGTTMAEVGSDTEGSSSVTADMVGLTEMVENSIAANIRNVLGKLYGVENVAVSVRGTINMEKLIQESVEYSTPEKINEEDKSGLLEQEDVMNESSQTTACSAGGVVGTDADADAPRYTNDDGTGEEVEGYNNGSASRTWLYNMVKEQRQIDPGILEDTTVGIVILTNDTTVPQEDLIRLVANSSGIDVLEANDKITIVRSPSEITNEPIVNPPDNAWGVITTMVPLPLLIAIIAGILLILLLLLFLLLRRRRKKKGGEPEEDDFEGGDQLSASDLGLEEGSPSAADLGLDDDDDLNNSEEILNLRMQRSMRLKQNIGEFVDQNPQIAAKLVQSWLRGEEDLDGSSRKGGGSSGGRK